MKRLSRIIILLCIFTFLYPHPIFSGQQSAVELTILHVNDTHGHILPYIETNRSKVEMVSGAAYLAKMIQEERSQNPEGTLLLSAGDMFQGTPVSNLFKGQPVIDIMNYLKFDAMAVGNHEFDWGMDKFNHLVSSSSFPYLSANIKDNRGRYLPAVKPYIIVIRKDIKIAVIGVTTPEISFSTKPGHLKKMIVYRPEDILPQLIKRVNDEGANVIIVLSHLGLDADKELAQRVLGIHVIVGGHSHTALETPMVVGDTIIVHAGFNGLFLGVLKLRIDPDTGKILQHTEESELKEVLAGEDRLFDNEVGKIVHAYSSRIQKEYSRVVGETSVYLVRYRQSESNIGNLICDAMRKTINADIAFLNSGAIRANIPQGKITLEQVFTLLPFDNNLVTMKLTGKQILKILERDALMEQGILQVSGIKIRYDLSEPVGSRVKEVYIGTSPLDLQRTYTVTTVDFLAVGGDKFSTFKEGKNIVYGKALRDIFVSHLKKYSPVFPMIEGRIIMDMEVNGLKFHNEGAVLPRINLFDFKPHHYGLFRLYWEEYKSPGGIHRFDRAVSHDRRADSRLRG